MRTREGREWEGGQTSYDRTCYGGGGKDYGRSADHATRNNAGFTGVLRGGSVESCQRAGRGLRMLCFFIR